MVLKRILSVFSILLLGVFFSSFNLSFLSNELISTDTIPKPPKMSIGMEAYGGVVFHLDRTRRHGLVVSTENIGNRSAKYEWGCSGARVVGANGTKLGTGLSNTASIAGSCTEQMNAAQACLNYNKDGYDDWYLPSLEELELISEYFGEGSEFSELVDFDRANYFSSSQLNDKKYQGNYAWTVNLIEGYSTFSLKSSNHKVRAIRSF